jgi:lipoprotein-anchoring transpeptidase ErfK/SrfK
VTGRHSAALLVVAALASAGADRAGAASPSRHAGAEVARVVAPAVVRPRPGAGPIVRLLATRTSWSGAPQQLLVLGSRTGADGRPWLRVRLPGRPNGSSGWIRRDRVVVHHLPWWIDVSLSRRLVQVFRDGSLVRRFAAVVGAPSTPTPVGLYAVYEADPQPSAGDFVGSWVIQLTAFSDVLDNYGGGPGRVAIHGRGGASLADPLGTARSHGCVRVSNSDVQWLARTVAAGTPVRIQR